MTDVGPTNYRLELVRLPTVTVAFALTLLTAMRALRTREALLQESTA